MKRSRTARTALFSVPAIAWGLASAFAPALAPSWLVGTAWAAPQLQAPTPPAPAALTLQTTAPLPTPLPGTAPAAIEGIVARAHHPRLRWPDFPWYQDKMAAIYGPRGSAPLWLFGTRPSKQAADVVRILEEAATRGLPPVDYDVEYLRKSLETLSTGSLTVSSTAAGEFDAALTLLYMRHISDVHIGRINPTHLGYEGYDPEPKKYDLVQLVQKAIASDRIAETIEEAEPQFPQYRWLKQALARYRGLVEKSPPGAHDPENPKVLLDRRVRQLELAMERYRWLPVPELKARFLIVNVPAFEMWGFDWSESETSASMHMRVVVGKAVSTRTPIFTGSMRYVVFRPYWYLPRSIVKKEVLPGLKKDPHYLEKHEMEITAGGNDAAPALPTTAANLAKVASGGLGVRQRPGPKNSLGPAKFIFPNDSSIYLHGTPAQSLFGRERRDFSHGCIRVEDPVALAQFVLAGKPEGEKAKILEAMKGTRPQRVDLPRSLPVLIFYTTAIGGPGGQVRFFEDLYKHDQLLEEKLLAGEPYQP